MLYRMLNVALAATAIGVTSAFAGVSAPSFVNDEAVFWLDASTLSQLPGQEVTTWPDVRGEGHPVASTASGRVNPTMISIASGDLAGKQAVDFGNVGSNKDMSFDASQNSVVTVFFVMDIDNARYASLLGGTDGGQQRFCRESQNSYASNSAQTGNYSIWTNGEKIDNPLSTATPSGYNLITYRFDFSPSGFTPSSVKYLASDRNIDGRVGGKRLCEVIAFNRILDDWERCQVEGYLKQKWFGGSATTLEEAALEMLWKKAQVHFDASVASSFHYDTEDPTKVVQWDDISGHNNNFTQNTLAKNARLGGLSEIRGKPVYDTEGYSSGIDLVLNTRLTTTRTVFMVCDVIANNNVMWLGDHQMLRLIRGYDNSYFYQYAGEQVYGWSKATIWCNGVQVPTSNQPERAGELSVYVFRIPANCEWEYLGLDRDCDGYARNGGKRVAELITFDFEMPDAALNKITNLLIDKWTPTEEYINSIAPVHVDASSADNFNYTDANITGWKNVGFGADLYYYPQGYLDNTPYNMNYGAYGMTNGVPAFLMGEIKSNIDLAFTRLTNIRSVFWAMDIQRHGGAFFLGDPRMSEGQNGDYDYGRGGNGEYAYGYNAYWHDAKAVCDGTEVSNMYNEKPPYGMHVYDHVSARDLRAAAISGDRWCDHRNGGRAISELLILTNEVWGLSRVGVRKRIADKWTKRCGWAGAGDAEWGADKYRVFGADATVPEGGAPVKGIGFTADMTLDGDALAIGVGGFFANEDVTATVEAPVTGDVGVFGAGTVLFASAQTLQSLYVGCGATAELKPGSAITGNLTMLKDSKILVDVSGLGVKEYAEISIGGTVTLPEGGTFLDYVALSDDSHVLSISEDGKKILVNDSVPVRAIWKGGVDVSDPANWTCYDDAGDVIANKLPGMYVTNITLEADCDFQNWNGGTFHTGAVIDLMGHALEVVNLPNAVFPNSVITNSVDGTTATVGVTVASGVTASDSTAVLCGNVKFVKRGAGTFVGNVSQMYTGGTEVVGGMLKAGIAGTLKPFGVPVSDAELANIEVAPGAIFDFAQKCGWGGYRMTLAGGVLQNSNGGFDDADGGTFTNIVITADGSRFDSPGRPTPWGVFGNGTGSGGYAPTSIDLGSHDLTITVSWFFKLCNTTILGDGSIAVEGSDAFQTGVNGRVHANGEIAATNVNFRIETPLRLYAPFSLHDYEAAHNNLNTVGGNSTAEMKVFGTFRPASHDAFYGCTMQDGSTIDLSNRTGEGKMPFNLTCAMTGDSASCQYKSVTFAPNANVTVDLSAFANIRPLVNNYVLTWDAKPADSVKFVPDATTAKRSYMFRKDSTGLKFIPCGFTIFVR